MIRSLFTAATGMTGQQIEQDVIANNLANINTVGFKKSRANFQDLMYQVLTKAGSTSSTGIQLPAGIELGMGVKAISTQKIFTQGDYVQTGNSLDLAIEGDGFFQIDDGAGKTLYTRAGNFKMNKDGNIVNSEGLLLTPTINIPSNTVVITIDKTGSVSVTDQQGTVSQVGQIQLARFVNPAGLTSIGRNLFDKTDASGEPIVGNPSVDGRGTISQYFLEMSNVNVIDEMVKMIVGQRNYEINSKAVQTADAMLGIINNLKG
ncbi:MAG TPA: flagellar basal-body rod protein FlgG [Syntrophales bacterium]|nr:flagellar basal-body rod protein FlgG [Syntrophales bacterium]HPC00562.1 flagellar basal-body rod protein FlgG [Syntrophales bacterium]HRS86559.1 flagellar basal-body rod protein FlgG [Syntrophales bacterium]HRV42156.1 flagellar basal-body rod protein FlgG [Syntrophales bacterium]